MGDANSNGGTGGDTPESLKSERENFEQTVAGVRQMARDFDTLTEQRKQFDPERIAFHLQLKGPHLNRCVWAGIITPQAFQWHKPWMARKKALGEQMLKDIATLGETLVGWAEDLERREEQYRRANPEQQTARDPAGTTVSPNPAGVPVQDLYGNIENIVSVLGNWTSAAANDALNALYPGRAAAQEEQRFQTTLTNLGVPPPTYNSLTRVDQNYADAIDHAGTHYDDHDYMDAISARYQAQRNSAMNAMDYDSVEKRIITQPVYDAVMLAGSMMMAGMGPEPGSVSGNVAPKGFASAEQFNQANTELQMALTKSGITDARIGIRGSSVTGFRYATGAPFSPASDIDYFVESNQLTQGLKTSANIPGFVHPSVINTNFDAISEWSEIWSQKLGRKVSVGGFQLGTVPSGPIVTP